MAKKETTSEPAPLTEEDRAYAVAVVKKQAQLSEDAATEKVVKLPADKLAALVDAGRDGRVAECRALLGLPE